MPNTKLNPYLFFGGNCKDAMTFYKKVFGGELTLTTYGEGPENAHSDPKANSEEMKSKIMHARLNGDITILASDNPHNSDIKNTGQFSLSVEGDNEQKLKGYFEELTNGGNIMAPLTRQFWGDTFGMVTDKFGVNWMVTINNGQH